METDGARRARLASAIRAGVERTEWDDQPQDVVTFTMPAGAGSLFTAAAAEGLVGTVFPFNGSPAFVIDAKIAEGGRLLEVTVTTRLDPATRTAMTAGALDDVSIAETA